MTLARRERDAKEALRSAREAVGSLREAVVNVAGAELVRALRVRARAEVEALTDSPERALLFREIGDAPAASVGAREVTKRPPRRGRLGGLLVYEFDEEELIGVEGVRALDPKQARAELEEELRRVRAERLRRSFVA